MNPSSMSLNSLGELHVRPMGGTFDYFKECASYVAHGALTMGHGE
jgi:hypothetical protein